MIGNGIRKFTGGSYLATENISSTSAAYHAAGPYIHTGIGRAGI